MGINGGIAEIIRNGIKQLRKLMLVQDHLAADFLLRLHGLVAGFHRFHHACNFLIQRSLIQCAEIVLLIQLNALLISVVGRDRFHHGIIPNLAFADTTAVDDSLVMLVEEYFHGVQGTVREFIGTEHGICNLCGQILRAEIRKIAFHSVFACFIGGEGIGLIIDQQCLSRCLGNQLRQLFLCCGRIDQKIRIAQKFFVGNINRYLGVAGIGAAHRFQLTLHKEHLIAFDFVDIDFIVRYPGIGPEHGFQLHHPSFTLAFSAGPPSLTRTHSL